MGMITLKVSDELHKLVRIKVVEEDTTIKDYVTDLILKDLQKRKRVTTPTKVTGYSKSNPERILYRL